MAAIIPCDKCIHGKVCAMGFQFRRETANVTIVCKDIVRKTDVAPRAEVAREICCKIEKEIVAALESNYRAMREHNLKRSPDADGLLLERIYGKIDALRGIEGFVEELKKEIGNE